MSERSYNFADRRITIQYNHSEIDDLLRHLAWRASKNRTRRATIAGVKVKVVQMVVQPSDSKNV